MAEETLLSAARRLVRFIRIDLEHGGLISIATQAAIDTLDREVLKATQREKEQSDGQQHS